MEHRQRTLEFNLSDEDLAFVVDELQSLPERLRGPAWHAFNPEHERRKGAKGLSPKREIRLSVGAYEDLSPKVRARLGPGKALGDEPGSGSTRRCE